MRCAYVLTLTFNHTQLRYDHAFYPSLDRVSAKCLGLLSVLRFRIPTLLDMPSNQKCSRRKLTLEPGRCLFNFVCKCSTEVTDLGRLSIIYPHAGTKFSPSGHTYVRKVGNPVRPTSARDSKLSTWTALRSSLVVEIILATKFVGLSLFLDRFGFPRSPGRKLKR